MQRKRAWFDLLQPEEVAPLALDPEKIHELQAELHALKEELATLKAFVAKIPGVSGVPGRTEKDGKTLLLVRQEQSATIERMERAQVDGVSYSKELANALKTLKGTN